MHDRMDSTDKAALQRMRGGHAAAERRARSLRAAEGPDPDAAVREALAALESLARMGHWPGPRDPASERQVAEVRARWARIQRRARRGAGLAASP